MLLSPLITYPTLTSSWTTLPYPLPCPTLLPSHLISSPLLSPPLSYSLLPFNPFLSLPYPHISFSPPHYHTLHSLAYHTIPSVPFPMLPALSSQVPPHPFHTFLPLASPGLPSPLLSSPPLPSSLPSPSSRPSLRILYPTYSTLPTLPILPLPYPRIASPPLRSFPFPSLPDPIPYPIPPPLTPLLTLTSPTLVYSPLLYPLRYATLPSPPLPFATFAVCPCVWLSARTPIHVGLAGRKTGSDTDSAHVLVDRQTVGRTDWQTDR